MSWVFIILIVVFLIYVLYVFIHNKITTQKLKNFFSKNNVIVFGKKGSGKDLLFQHIINKRHKPYYSNISYGGKFRKGSFEMLNLGSNTYENFISGNIEKVSKKTKPFEDKDFYFSDAGIHIPSQYDSLLHKKYKGLPISYALSRHLWNNNIHVNTQNLERVWKALREQADSYIRVRKTRGFFLLWLKVEITLYDKYESAKNNLSPVSRRVWNKYSRAERDVYNATNGLVEDRFFLIRKSKISYDTRAYHKLIFGRKFSK